MKDRIARMKKFFVTEKRQKNDRQEAVDPYILANRFAEEGTADTDRSAQRLIWVLEKERPVLYEEERIAFTRTVPVIPEIFTPEELAAIKKEHWLHEKGDVCNINVNYLLLLQTGIVPKQQELEELRKTLEDKGETQKAHYVTLQISILDRVLSLSEQYRELAKQQGNHIVAKTLERVPAQAPESFLEALQMFRILHFTMWCGHNYHNTIGRFDQFMYPWFVRDMEQGIYDEDNMLELLEEFFLTFNRDSDLYPGMQQGDNGQSMVLGGLQLDGSDSYNALSRLCMQASLELKLIDPKINLRVHKDTPMEHYILGTKLTKEGLGFPQYSNDDVVIPGLLALGYEKEDAYNYVVAACWEFIIPGTGMDIPNIDALSFASAVEDAVIKHLAECADFEELYSYVKRNIFSQAEELMGRVKNLYQIPAPFLSLMMDGCCKNARDVSLGCKYNNYGLHGTGIATAADSLAAVKKFVFEEKSVTAQELLDAIDKNYEGYELLCNRLRYEAPKMGNDDDYVDSLAVELLRDFADALHADELQEKRNDRGGIFRAGTGSAMFYLWHAQDMQATPDGRYKEESLGANYSPSLFGRCSGPVSILKSFAKPDLKRVINGGPLTLELHDTVFRTQESVEKVAMLVKSFMELGGHQLQLNAVNRETMLDAQKHPENYRNLIVRVWGWSGYFVELDKVYQDHIIQRMELAIS